MAACPKIRITPCDIDIAVENISTSLMWYMYEWHLTGTDIFIDVGSPH